MEIDYSNLTSEKLTDFHCLSTFTSGVEAMDKFIRGDFRMSVENHYSLQVRKEGKRTVHHPAPAPHHPKAPVKVDKRHGITNHTLANNTPRHGHSNAGHFGRR